ncbi:MAG: MBL fold metallo-hydrolase [Halobacteriaceae archaeon]
MTAGAGQADADAGAITPRELYQRLAAGERVTVLDVRDRDAFERWHVEGPSVAAVQHPYARFLAAAARDAIGEAFAAAGLDAPGDGDPPVTVVCGRGEASGDVADRLDDAGIRAVNLAGGMDAWRDLAVTADLPSAATPPDCAVVQVCRPATGCLGYVVVAGSEAAVVDPLAAQVDEYRRIADDHAATLRWAVDTHVHADHVSGVRALAGNDEAPGGAVSDGARVADDATPPEAVLPAGARDRGLAYEVRTVEDGDRLTLDGGADEATATALRAVHAPGHTSELTAFRVGDVLLSADCLFLAGVGRPDLEAADAGARDLAATLHETLTERFADLPDDLLVAPGHVDRLDRADADGRYVATLGTLRERLPVFDLETDAFVERVLADPTPRPANYEAIVDVNLGRGSVDAETAADLELGPNNCAVSSAD